MIHSGRCPACGGAIGSRAGPRCTVDAIIETAPERVLLIRRKFPPRGWALPGGFVEIGESLEEACRREVLEETGLRMGRLRQFGAYSDPGRDPRRHTITVVFHARARGRPVAGSDAAEIASFPLRRLPSPICFDHREILRDFAALERRWRLHLGRGRTP